MGYPIRFKMNIPNGLSILRILLVPVFVALYLKGIQPGQEALQYWSFVVLALSGLTDCFDGMIARRFHQITDLGKILDPVADKMTQMAVLICLVVHYPRLLPLLIICVCKELGQLIGSAIMLHRGAAIQGAKWYGKLTTIVFYLVMAAFVLWGDRMNWIVMLVLGGGLGILMLFAFFNYVKVFLGAKKEIDRKHDVSGR